MYRVLAAGTIEYNTGLLEGMSVWAPYPDLCSKGETTRKGGLRDYACT